MKELITHEELVKYCKYNPSTGIFTKRTSGIRVGSYDKATEQRVMNLKGKKYRESRVAVFYVTKQWPVGFVKNISNRRSLNTKFKNLEFKINELKEEFPNHESLPKCFDILEKKECNFVQKVMNCIQVLFALRR